MGGEGDEIMIETEDQEQQKPRAGLVRTHTDLEV